MAARIAVTGAGGFLGRCLCAHLTASGHSVRALVRGPDRSLPVDKQFPYCGLTDESALHQALRGADTVIHLAAAVHRMAGPSDSVEAYHAINVEGTHRVASIAAEEGVGELLFASSVKVMGESSDRSWTEDDLPNPYGPYAATKLEAEHTLAAATATTGIATVVLRLPLMYGPGMKANILRLFHLVDKGIPLPLSGINNARSLLYSGNAAVAFERLIGNASGHEVFFVADGDDVSTPQLIRHIGSALGRPSRLLPAPRRLLHALAHRELGYASATARRLTGSLSVNISRLSQRIGPMPFRIACGLSLTAEWYRKSRTRS